jgi:hypothetical protein
MFTRPTWLDFYEEELGPRLPLQSEQLVSPVSGVLPSGEGGGFDFSQYRKPINKPFPYPNLLTPEILAFSDGQLRSNFPDNFSDEWWDASGVIKSYPESEDSLYGPEDETTILHFNGLSSSFSNAVDSKANQIENFRIFNPYIHYN